MREQQISRDLRRTGGDENPVERRLLRPAERAVAVAKVNVADVQIHQPLERLIQQRLDPLHAVDFFGDLAEYRGLVSAARADLQHAAGRLEHQPVGHQRDDIRLADGLPVPDGQGASSEGAVALLSREKLIARRRAHGGDHPRIRDPPIDHFTRAFERLAKDGLGPGRPPAALTSVDQLDLHGKPLFGDFRHAHARADG